jgi:predicted RNA-binding Zn ribbon-like protein
MSKHLHSAAYDERVKLGGHPALDILNTVARVDGKLVDSLQTDDDVLRWLSRIGLPVETDFADIQGSSLLQTARELRETLRTLIEKRKKAKRIDPAALNAFLAEARNHLHLVSNRDGSLRLKRQWEQRSPEQVLAPLAELGAELLFTGNFSLVRRCENEECVLWFYDRTKSHHRRWCSMTTCGNRHKVAAFRERRQRTGNAGS